MFNCDKCGSCCRNIAGIKLFSDMDDGMGVCKFLDQSNNLCKIYNSRPIFCNVDEMYKKYFKNLMPLEEFYNLNYMACEKLKELKKLK